MGRSVNDIILWGTGTTSAFAIACGVSPDTVAIAAAIPPILTAVAHMDRTIEPDGTKNEIGKRIGSGSLMAIYAGTVIGLQNVAAVDLSTAGALGVTFAGAFKGLDYIIPPFKSDVDTEVILLSAPETTADK